MVLFDIKPGDNITVKELKEYLKDVPDDSVIIVKKYVSFDNFKPEGKLHIDVE